jgi:hypothetical protein
MKHYQLTKYDLPKSLRYVVDVIGLNSGKELIRIA